MLKYLKFSGIYHDENLSVHVTFENPLDCGIEATALTFSVAVKTKNSSVTISNLDDFNFYIMDETNRLFNAQKVANPIIEADPDNNEIVSRPDWLILTDFQPNFLYQDLRIVFYHQSCRDFHVIELRH